MHTYMYYVSEFILWSTQFDGERERLAASRV